MQQPTCTLCGEPMPEGEEMFKYHGYSGPCPVKPGDIKHSTVTRRVHAPFRFCPQDKVRVTLNDAGYHGRVTVCHHDGRNQPHYSVLYSNANGEFMEADFLEDEIELL